MSSSAPHENKLSSDPPPLNAPPDLGTSSATNTGSKAREQHIDPLNVSGAIDENGNTLAIDYDALREKFGTPALTSAHLERFERVTGKKPHRLMRRKLFFSHRDFDSILDFYEKEGRFLLYTGRGPSSDSMHIGHAVPFLFTKELQDIFDVPLVIMMTDDEKFQFRGAEKKMDPRLFTQFAHANTKDIIALGFDVKKTFIYTDYEFIGGHFLYNISEFETLLTNNQVRGAMGFDGSTNIGCNSYPARQCVAAFASSYPELFGAPDYRPLTNPDFCELFPRQNIADIPTLIPCAIDQEPYFRLVRENCHRMHFPSPKPALILSRFLTALQGPGGKMSASDPTSAIFMSDTPNQIKNKINKYAFSGGRETREEHEKYGGNPDVDVAYTYLSYFLESDEELKEIEDAYRKGTLGTGELKKKCISVLQEFVGAFQERRAKVDDAAMRSFMKPRKLVFQGNPHATHPRGAEAANGEAQAHGEGAEDGKGLTKNQQKKLAKLKEVEERKAKKAQEKEMALRQKEGGADGAVEGGGA
ncbi:tryptophan--tRNA ligase [Elasticomyces elasticus]|nr:tryptophan--tRNA ligase [Elasticomyces elasticus]